MRISNLVVASVFVWGALFQSMQLRAQGWSHKLPSSWQGDECLVADPTGTPLNVRQTPSGQIVGTLRNGEGVVHEPSTEPWVEVYKVTQGHLSKLGWAWKKFIDCNVGREVSRYPVYFRDHRQLIELDIAWSFAAKRANFTACPYQGEAHTISIANDVIDGHIRRGFSLPKLCLMLASGSVRYDPVTGERLPTYLFSGWPDYGRLEEFLLKVPDCFKSGAISGMGTYWHTFEATGCALNFHPWTGRRLAEEEKKPMGGFYRCTQGAKRDQVLPLKRRFVRANYHHHQQLLWEI